ncbi:hypothetical protein [Microbacterium sp. NPDC087665]|uniref:hypothetical protein n=1 Tax=Microbacterium sp. NPDC087665 TaxID=3364194 RepID=UPI0038219670
MTGEELFDQAREVNFTYKAAVADVQLQLFDGEWTVEGYGDSSEQCGDDGYMFRLGRSTPFEWRFEGSPAEAGERIAAWLDENGWSDIKTRTYSGDVDNVLVEAEKPESHVALLTIDFNPGERSDMITINADSTCEVGDANEVFELRRPGYPDDERSLEVQPSAEDPTAKPSFGYTEDGKRRFWPNAR